RCAVLDAPDERVVLGAQPLVAVRPSRVLLAVRAAVAGVGAQRLAQRGQPVVGAGVPGGPAHALGRAVGQRTERVAHRGAEVAAVLGPPRAEVLADLHTGDGAGAVGHLAADEATHLAAVGQHGDRTAVETRRRRLQDDGVAGPPPARHLD